MENPFVNSAVRPVQWRDCEIYVTKKQYIVTLCNQKGPFIFDCGP